MLCNKGATIKARFTEAKGSLEKAKRARDFAGDRSGEDRLQEMLRESQLEYREALCSWWVHLRSCRDCRSDM